MAFEEQGPVGAAESERIAQGNGDFGGPGLVGHVIQVTLRIRILVVDGRRQDLVKKGQGRKSGLQPSGRTQQVPGHGLGRAHGQFVGMSAEQPLDGQGLDLVVPGGTRKKLHRPAM